ncbi:MAG TPA: hypothetical protein PKL31_01540 [Fulvivirga sp.]|nr:hypothetical protein [Fulvivirga sp.]
MEDKNTNKNIYKVPEGYFDQLPDKIIARVEAQKSNKKIRPLYAVVSAVAASLLILAMVIFNDTSQPVSAEELLSTVSTADLIDYLAESDINTEDIINEVDWTENNFEFDELDYIENNMTEEDLDQIMGDFDPDLELI